MKILHVTKKYPPALGGDAIVVANLRRQQQAAGHTVAVVTSNCDQIPASSHIYKVGLKDTPTQLDAITLRRIVSLVVLFFRMFAIAHAQRPNVIHTHSVDMAFVVSFAARLYGIPVVHTFHIVTFYDRQQPAIRRKSELWLAKKAKLRQVTAPNVYDVKKLQKAGLHQCVLLPNGVDIEAWEPHGYTEKNKIFTFLAIGRLESQKGYDYLIKAAFLLATKLPTAFNIIIVGEGSQREPLRALAQSLQIDDIVSFAGRKSQPQMYRLFCEADAVILPSLYETTPLTLLEAWAAARPVIVTSVGIMRDVPADFGAAYIVPPKDETSLMRAMYACITDEAANAVVAAKGHQEVKKYAWPIIARTAETIYRGTQ